MTRAILIVSCATVMVFGGGFISNMSFSYGGDSGKMDKNFVRDNEKEVVKDLNCSDLSYLGHTDWKLPTKEELKAILELGRRDLNVKRAFKNIQEGIYWSSTKDRRSDAWYVDFDLGRYSTADYDHNYYVLCVRQGK